MENILKKREDWIDIAKGIAIIFVVLGHVATSYANSGYKENEVVLEYLYNVAYSFHMPLFFAIAGYLSHRTTKNNVGSQIKNKIIAYGIPYIAFSIADFVLKSLAGTLINSSVTLTQLILIPVIPIGILWYLYDLMIISVIHILFKKFFGENRICFKVVLLFTLIAYVGVKFFSLIDDFEDSFILKSILMDIPRGYLWYLCAFLYGEQILCKLKMIKSKAIYLIIPMYVVYVNFRFCGIINELFTASIGIMIVVLCSLNIGKSKALQYIGKNTLPIYLLHGYFIAAVRIALTKLSVPTIAGLVPTLVCGFFATVCPLLAYTVIKKVKFFDFFLYPLKYIHNTYGVTIK